MYPPKFDYERPESVDRVLELLAQHGDEAKILSGGQSLIPVLKLRFAQPEMLVDVNAIPNLEAIEERNGHLILGTRTRHSQLADSKLLQQAYPAIATAGKWVADPLVRNLGTLGGSLAHADPQGDWGSVMLAMNASFVLRSKKGERVVAATDFFQGVFTTVLEPEEMLVEVRVPKPQGKSGGTYLKLERKIGDFATVGVSIQIEMSNGTISRAGIGLTAVGLQNLKAEAAEQVLAGQAPSEAAFAAAAEEAVKISSPNSDIRGSADFKRSVVRAYVQRGLAEAVSIAQAN